MSGEKREAPPGFKIGDTEIDELVKQCQAAEERGKQHWVIGWMFVQIVAHLRDKTP